MARKDSLKEMREVLLERRTALRQAIAGDDSLLKEISQRQGGDEADFALDCSHGEINSQLVEASSRELAQIENAIIFLASNMIPSYQQANLMFSFTTWRLMIKV